MTTRAPVAHPEPAMGPLFLVGMMGSGKSAVGRGLAQRAKVPFIDLDRRLERLFGASVSELFARGEAEFRRLERASLVQLVAEPAWGAAPCVVATGGGVVLDADSRADMRRTGCVVLLRVAPDELAARLAADDSRPLLAGADGATRAARLADLWHARAADYRAAAHVEIDAAGPVEAVAERVWQAWRAA